MCRKQNTAIRVSGTDQNGTAATASMTSDVIAFPKNQYWSINVWFKSLTVAGTDPEFTLQVSDSSDTDSFISLSDATDITAPEYVESEYSKWKYFRVLYDPKGATGGTKYFSLSIGK